MTQANVQVQQYRYSYLMSKITFRADDTLVSRLEALDTSKSEVMRKALRRYLDETERESTSPPDHSASGELTIDELLTDRLDHLLADRPTRRQSAAVPEVTVSVSFDGLTAADVSVEREDELVGRKTTNREKSDSRLSDTDTHCAQCGEAVDESHVYCPNCGEKASHRLFCECGDEIQSDWGFCPSCGRRTPAAGVLDNI